MRLSNCVFVLAVIGSLVMHHRLHAAVNVIESSLHLTAESRLNGVVDSSTDLDSQLTTLNPLSADVEAIVLDGTNSVRSYGSASATWNDAAHGSVDVTAGWETAVDGGSVSEVKVKPESGGWSYSFSADVESSFVLDYSVLFSGSDVSGLNGFFVLFDGIQLAAGQVDPGGSPGSISVPVSATSPHEIQIWPGSNIIGDLRTRNAEMTAQFEWRIIAVPEPGGLTLASLFGAVMAASWRRRPAAN